MRLVQKCLSAVLFASLASCASTPGANTTVSLFLHDEDAIRIEHGTGNERVLRRSIRPSLTDDDVLDGWPLIYSQHRSNICPAGRVDGIIGCFPVPDANWCEISSWITGQDHPRGPFRTNLPLSSGSIDLSEMQSYCPYDVASTPSQSVIAASLWIDNGSTQSQGILITRINDQWQGHTDIPGWSESRPVRNPAISGTGTWLCFEVDGQVRCGAPVDPAGATTCGNGTLPTIAEVNGNDSVSWLQGDRFKAAPLNNCDIASFTSSPHPAGTIVSTDGHENSSVIVYLLDTPSGTDLYEYSFRTNTHNRVLSDSRKKTSVSLVRN